LVLDLASREACSRLRNKWIGLPAAEQGVSGAEQGLAVLSGRWFLRECTQDIVGQSLRLRIAGPGWQWVDEEQSGFHVRQYVYFAASVDLQAALDVAYDGRTGIASMWLTPVERVGAKVDALGTINAHPESLFASIGGAVGPVVGLDPDDIAQARAGMVGAEQMRLRLTGGATLTYDTRVGQLDFIVGQLPNGVAPQRPFAASEKWLMNERQGLYPGGFQIAGSFEPTSEALLDVVVEQGPGVAYRPVCAPDAQQALDTAISGGSSNAARGAESLWVPAGSRYQARLLPPPCPWALVTSATAGSAAVAVQLRSVGAPPLSFTGGAIWAQLTLLRFKFNAHSAEGKPWDPFGGAPDPEIWIGTERGHVVFVPKMQNTFEAQPMARAPLVEVTATRPLQIGATESDAAVDDPMGIAEIPLDELRGRGPNLSVDFRQGGVSVGTADVRVEFVQHP
jgi:hypothetical protein